MILHGDALTMLKTLPDESVNCCVTSPPYWGLRDYGVDGQLGLERTPEEYASKMVEVFREVKRVLKSDGTLLLNLGDSYASDTKGSGGPSAKQLSNAGSFHNVNQRFNHGLKPKDLVGIPWRVAFALQADGWYLRQDIIWHKPNPMPESVKDRCTKSHEYIFLLTKSARYFYDNEAVKEPFETNPGPLRDKRNEGYGKAFLSLLGAGLRTGYGKGGRNKRSVWTITTKPFKEAHFATFPPDLIEPCILAGCPEGGIVLDPFFGAGTTGLVCSRLNRQYIGIELNGEYIEMARRRIEGDAPLLNVGVLPL